MKKPVIIVIGRNYTSRLGMIRAVGMAGYDVIVIQTNGVSPNKGIDSYSKYVRQHFFAREPDRGLLMDVLRQIAENEGPGNIIIPVDDYASSVIDDNLLELKDLFLFPNVDMAQGMVNHFMDKSVQKEMARSCGLNVAGGWTVVVKNGKFEIPDSIVYPCFPKPLVSFTGNKTCMVPCGSKNELFKVLESFSSNFPDCDILIEEFKRVDKEYATLGYSDGKSVVLPGMIQVLKDGSGHHKGVTLLGRLLPPAGFSAFFEQLKAFILNLHFVGLFDIDSYESSGQLFFNELNLRFGASGYAVTSKGVNLPEMLIDTLIGNDTSLSTSISDESLFVNEKVAYEDLISGYISRKRYNHFMSDDFIHFIKNDEDPEPFVRFSRNQRYGIKSRVLCLLRNLKLR